MRNIQNVWLNVYPDGEKFPTFPLGKVGGFPVRVYIHPGLYLTSQQFCPPLKDKKPHGNDKMLDKPSLRCYNPVHRKNARMRRKRFRSPMQRVGGWCEPAKAEAYTGLGAAWLKGK